MLIQVMYRDVFSKYFKTGPYTYNCDLDVKVGDIVLVETRFGLSVAQVYKLNVKLLNKNDYGRLKNVLEVCKTKYPFEVKDE